MNAVAPPSCRRQIPIFPVRYAIMPSEEAGYDYPKESALKNDFPELEHSRYCLRTLRNAGYVYVYDGSLPFPWSCFYYGQMPVIGFYQLQIHPTTGQLKPTHDRSAKRYIVIDNHVSTPETVQLCYTDTPFSADTLKRLEDAGQRDKVMQSLDIGHWHDQATSYWDTEKQALPKEKIPQIPHAFHVDNMTDYVLEYYKYHSWYGQEVYSTDWSEEDPENNIHPAEAMAQLKIMGRSTQLCFALYDAVGMASELSHLVGYEVAKLHQFIDINARKVQAMASIKTLTNRAGDRAYRNVKNNAVDDAMFNSSALSGGALNNAHRQRQERQKVAEKQKRMEFGRHVQREKFTEFEQNYPKQLEALKTDLEQAGEDHVTWLENIGPGSLYFALDSYDAKSIESYIGLREAVARSTMALPASTKGTDYGTKQFTESGAVGIFNQALHGNPEVEAYVEKTKTLGFVLSEHASAKSEALITLLEKIPSDNASKTLAGVATAFIPHIKKVPSLEYFESSRYLGSLEAMEGVFASKKSLKLHDFLDEMSNKVGAKKTEKSFVYITKNEVLQKRLSFPITMEVPVERSHYEINQERALLKKTAFWSDIKIAASSLGLFLGTFGVLNALEKLETDDKNILVNSLGLSSSLFNLGAATSGTVQVVYGKRAALARVDNKKRALKAIEEIADKTALFLLIGAAIMGSAKTIIMARDTSGRRRQAYAGAFGAHLGVATIGTYHLLTKVAQTSSTAAKAVTAINATRAGKVLARINPYTGIALLIGEAIAFGLEKYAEAQADEKVLDWIEQSTWGIKPNRLWDNAKEQYALNDLFIKPKITTDFKVFGGDNNLTVLLPAYRSQVSAFDIIDDGKNITEKAQIKITSTGAILTVDDVDWIGQIKVTYWPDQFTQPEITYKATD